MRILLACFALLVTQVQAVAETRYIDDTIFVPVRSGQGSNYRILHKGLRSGTAVTLLQENAESGWSEVRTEGGVQGWLPTRYLSDEPGARQQLAAALQRIDMMNSETKPLVERIDQLSGERAALQQELSELRTHSQTVEAELTEVKQISANALQLDRANKQLAEQAEQLKAQIEVLEADNQRLRDEEWQSWFLNGVYATGMGGLLVMVLPRLFQRRRRSSEWV